MIFWLFSRFQGNDNDSSFGEVFSYFVIFMFRFVPLLFTLIQSKFIILLNAKYVTINKNYNFIKHGENREEATKGKHDFL